MMQVRESLVLHWHSFSGGGCDIVTSIFTHKRGQYCDYRLLQLHSPVTIQDVRWKIVDILLMLIWRMCQRECRFLFYISRQRILPLWNDETLQPFYCRKGNTENHWCSIDTHLENIILVLAYWTIVCKMHTVIIESQHIVSMYNHSHLRASRSLNSWPTTLPSNYAMTNVVASCFSTFSRQFTAYRSIC